MATEERLRALGDLIESAFRQHGPMTVKQAAVIVGYHISAIYPYVKPPKYTKLKRDSRRNRDGKRGGAVWGLKERK